MKNPLDDAALIRHADAELLSLALIDTRNHTLGWLALFEDNQTLEPAVGPSPLWLAGRGGWFQEFWISRHVQRQRGEQADVGALRLASIHPRADDCFAQAGHEPQGLDVATLRAYLATTLETTLELLATAGGGDEALYVYRQALLHEDQLGEALAEGAAALQLRGAWPAAPVRAAREALWMPAQQVMLGSAPGGLVPHNERWAHEVAVPEFEIDAQAVSWARYIEFAEDAGYDRQEFWSDAGWAWAQAQGRRAPRDVEQLRGGVLVQRQGQLQRAPAGQAVVHVSRFEAEAWCRWAGRRLPAEPEWELAAVSAASRGFVWGDVFEWVAGSARPWPGYASTPGAIGAMPAPGTQGVLRGASWLSRARCRHPKARRFAAPESDTTFCGFRSCAL